MREAVVGGGEDRAVDVDRAVDFRLLGAFEMVAFGRAVDLGSARQRVLLAMLTLARNTPVSVGALAEELWGEHPPGDVAAGLQSFVSRARRTLAGAGPGGVSISARGNAYVLAVDGARVDAERFARLVARGRERARAGAPEQAAEAFRRALAMWRGPALADMCDRPFARVEAARLNNARLETSEALTDALLAVGNPAEALAVLEPLVAGEPFREDAHGRLMVALYRLGRQADALGVYRSLRRALTEELGLEPGEALRRLERLILAQDPELDGPAPPVATGGARPHQVTVMASAGADTRALLFTEIESCTRRGEGEQDAMAADLARHDVLLCTAVESRSGRVLNHNGDGLCADFPTAAAALQAALDGQRALAGEPWRGHAALRVRMAVHAGAAQALDESHLGPTLNRAARLMSLARGGQILCSQAVAELARDALPAGLALVDLGEHRLADLARPERVFQVAHPELPDNWARLAPPASPRHNLPTAVGRFVGRTAELAELEKLVAAARMLTLCGPGGVGKTRLCLELAARSLAGFPDGVWFVELAPLDRAELVAPAVMSALGMLAGRAGVTPTEAICRYLASRRALLLLDNCEHLLAPAAELVHAVLTHCPGVRVVTSSREPLGVGGEHIWAVPSLTLPGIEDDLGGLGASDAVALFCDRARAAHSGFALTTANAAAVGEVCRSLDGLPLALELAAARIRVLGVNGLADHLGDRLRLLTGGPRTAHARHQTLRAAVDWSYQLLPVPERDLLARLAVFPASFDLAAAQAVSAAAVDPPAGFEILELLTRLAHRSLVVPLDLDGQVRYRLLETIRHYAAERLDTAGATHATQRRHLQHYLSLPITDRTVRWTWESEWVAQVHRDHDNLRAALDWALAEGDADAAVRLVATLASYWVWADHPGARCWIERALSLPGRPRHAATAEVLALFANHWHAPTSLGREALALAEEVGEPKLLALVCLLVSSRNDEFDPMESDRLLEVAQRLSQATGFGVGLCMGGYFRAWRALSTGEYAAAVEVVERDLAAAPAGGHWPIYGPHMIGTLAVAAALVGDADRALSLAEDAVAIAHRQPLTGLLALALARAVAATAISRRWARAEEYLREQLVLLRRLGTHRWAGETIEFAALTLEATHRPMAAARALAAADHHRAALDEAPGGPIPAVAAQLAQCRAHLRIHSELDASPAPSAVPALDQALLDALYALGTGPD